MVKDINVSEFNFPVLFSLHNIFRNLNIGVIVGISIFSRNSISEAARATLGWASTAQEPSSQKIAKYLIHGNLLYDI